MKMVHLVTNRRDILLPLHEQVTWQEDEQVISTEVVDIDP
jgi:hypothetical protein